MIFTFYLLNTSGSGSRDRVFLFLACLTVPCPYPARFGERKYRSRSEDDFLSANPAGA